MSQPTSLKELERNLFKSATRDGLLEIQIGFVALIFVIAPYLSPYLGDFWSAMIFLPIWIGVIYGSRAFRKHVIQPRIGTITYGSYRKKRMTAVGIIALLVNLAALILGLLSFFQFNTLPPWIHSIRFSIIVLVGFSLAGYSMEFPRLYLYGILLAAAVPAGEYLYQEFSVPHHGFPVTFGIASGMMILIGAAILTRLLKANPKSEGELPA